MTYTTGQVFRGKLVVVGDAAVGKSATCQMYCKDGSDFPKNYNMTFAPDVLTKLIPIPDSEDQVEFIIYDSPSFDLYTELLDSFWKGPDMVMFMYDVTNRKSLERISTWYEVTRQVHWSGKNGFPIASVLFGNKTDLSHRHIVREDEAVTVAERFLMKHFTGSAKNNHGLEDPFRHLAQAFYKHCIAEEN